MIKRFCDRCDAEIAGEPWYMSWRQNETDGFRSAGVALRSFLCSRADSVSSYSNAVLQFEGTMYCDKCKAEILAFAAKKLEQKAAELEVIPTEKL